MSTIYQMNDDADEIDGAMSQIEYLYETKYGMDDQFDEMDDVMSQIEMNDADVDAMIEICDTDIDQMDGGYKLVDHRDGREANFEIVGEPDLEADDNVEVEADGDVEFEAAINDIPAELLQEYQEALDQILPKKSASRYLQAYAVFRKWQQSRKTDSFDEKVIMVYFSEAAKKYKPSTLWSMYSMLKKTLICKNNIDISKISQLIAFLKTFSSGFKSKKSNVFCSEEVRRFMVEAPDISFLGIKVLHRKFSEKSLHLQFECSFSYRPLQQWISLEAYEAANSPICLRKTLRITDRKLLFEYRRQKTKTRNSSQSMENLLELFANT